VARILIIDDEETLVYTFDCFLSEEGHEVLVARNYDEALRHISEKELDLVFSDIILGGNTGIDVLREIKERGLTCPVVMITGFPNIETAAEAVRLGAFDYLAKPVVKQTLLHLTKVALQHKEALDERERHRAHLDAIFMSVEDAIVTLDKDLRVLELNEAATAICGLARDAVGKRLVDMEMPCRENFISAVEETLQTLRSVRLRRLECRTRGKPSMVLSVSVCPLTARQGSSMGAVMVVRDETRLADLEHDLRERRQFHNIIGKSEAMQNVYSLVESLADVETTVLITGESGTGKELVAEALHHRGVRSSGPFVKVNCSALAENLLESELFGHVKGAFTDATADRTGRFQMADGGTILLDEIGDISHWTQLRLLRVLQEREFERVGDSHPTRVDIRVIASTNRNLKEKVELGELRADLYFRLKVVEIPLPPLRGRREDIPLLVEHFIDRLNRKLKREISEVSPDVKDIFMEYSWPGNVRELEHVLEHAFILCRQETICVGHLPPEIRGPMQSGLPAPWLSLGPEAKAIYHALRKVSWNKAKAARLIGFDRKTLYRKMSRYGIPFDEISE
jgi:PAS domain S-box-containing protein